MIEKLNGIELSRESLYEKVWSTPITEIAKFYSVRDHEIIKLCDKNNIPRPPSGYWSKFRHGFKIERPPLLPVDQAPPIALPPKYLNTKKSKIFTPKNAHIYKKSEDLPHFLVTKTYRAYGSISPDNTDRLRSKEESLNIYVGYRTLDRAMNFVDILIKELESLGHSLLIRMNSTGDQWLTYAVINGERVPFYVEETSERKRIIGRNREWSSRNLEYVLTGELKLCIDHYFGETRQPSWTETKTISLEERLPQIIEGFLHAAEKLKVARIEEEKRLEERRHEEQNKRAIEAEERFRKEQIAQLEPCSITWEKANRIRGFVFALETAAIKKFGPMDPNSEIAALINRARAHADAIDPVIQSIKLLNEKQ